MGMGGDALGYWVERCVWRVRLSGGGRGEGRAEAAVVGLPFGRGKESETPVVGDIPPEGVEGVDEDC
jgi:hypothetical protein